jgi:hypothetical protein
MDNFHDEVEEAQKFDVIMDALDPDKMVDIVGSLYKDTHFVESLFHGLTKEGVVSGNIATALSLSCSHPNIEMLFLHSSSCKLVNRTRAVIQQKNPGHLETRRTW